MKPIVLTIIAVSLISFSAPVVVAAEKNNEKASNASEKAASKTEKAANSNDKSANLDKSSDKSVKPAKAAAPASVFSSITKNIQSKGFTTISYIKFEDGKYTATVVDTTGKLVRINFNDKGEIVGAEPHNPTITMQDALIKLEQGNYNINRIRSTPEGYTVKTIDKDGKVVKLKVNGKTGDVQEVKVEEKSSKKAEGLKVNSKKSEDTNSNKK